VPSADPRADILAVVPLDRISVTQVLSEAGSVAASDEADELIEAAAGDPGLLEELVGRRTRGEPVAWLTGVITFCDVKLFVTPGVYVPRWQTEPLARRAVNLLPSEGVAVDLCTGVGAIAAVLALAAPAARVVATELEDNAVQCALRNGVEVYQGYLDDPLPPELKHGVDVMTAVVPYVPANSFHLLPRDVREFESALALDGGEDGMDFLREVVRRSTEWLTPGAWLLLELGGDQAESIGQLLHERGFRSVDVMVDEDGDPRAICGQFV
jgi:release factor glutamine methyltransferase